MKTTQKLAVSLILAGLFLLSVGSRFTIEVQEVESVGLVPIVGEGVAQTSDYRWRDVADSLYSANYRTHYEYSQAQVEITFGRADQFFKGTLTALNLKPNFAYQMKLVGIPGTSSNEMIGLTGRWWQEQWDGTAWTNGQNLNDKGNGSSPNPNDEVYSARKLITDASSPTGYRFRYIGYLLFGYLITDSNGGATLDFETGSSYHVLWKTTQRTREADDGPLNTVTFDPNPTQPAYDADYPSSTVSIFGEWERLPIGGVLLPPGDYSCEVVLTEESFHGSGGTYAGNWASAVERSISFTIALGPRQTACLLLTVEPDQAAYTRRQSLAVNVDVLNQLNPPLNATLTLTVTGPGSYYYFDFQPVNVTANAVGEYSFSWNIPDVEGTYVIEVSIVPPQLTAYDVAWLRVA
jgi:hypothetical protein